MSAYQGDVQVLENYLQDFKSRAQEMNVGVNYNALEEERKRQELLLQELRDIESKLSTPSIRKTNLPNLASLAGVELEQNTRCLRYLTGISELERYISDVAAHFAERSIELSDPQALHSNVFSYKTLTDNVKSCWDYVEQLTMLAQIHIKTSAEYHQFFHEANEVEAKLEKQLQIAQRRQNAATEQNRRIKDVSTISNELREQLETMRNLWSRCIALVKRSESVVPIRLRIGGVSEGEVTQESPQSQNGPTMVRALVSLTGPEYRIKQGELLRLIDNQNDSHLWKVQTSSGIVKVPSVCFWVTGNDVEAAERASMLKQHCKKTWLEIVRLSRQRLYFEYIDILDKLTEKNPVCAKQKAFTDLIADIHNHLITPEEDDDRLRIALEKFQRSVIFSSHAVQEGEYALKETDLVRLRAPLLRLQDHLMAVGLMQDEMKRLNEYIENYLIEVKNEQKRISMMVDHLKRITTESQVSLADLSSQLSLYTENATKRPQYALPEIDEIYRSKSQPFDIEVSSRPKRKLEGKRARSQTVYQLDAMVQIGSKCRSIETQSIDTTSGTDDSQRTPKKRRSDSRIRRPPVQRCVMTQIGPSSKESCTQVDSPESSTTEECYVTEKMKANVRQSPDNRNPNRRRDARSVSVHKKRPVIQINSCTQLGTLKSERSASPILSLINCCHQCQSQRMRCRLVCEHISAESPRTYDTTDSYCQTLSSYGSTVRYINHDYATSCTQIGTITRDSVISPVDFDFVPPVRCRGVERPLPSRAASHSEDVYVEPLRKRRHSQEIQCVNVHLDYTSPHYANIARSYPNIDRVYENAVNIRSQREGHYEVHDHRRRTRLPEIEVVSCNHTHAVPTRYTTGTSYHHSASLPNLVSNEIDAAYSEIPPVPLRRRRNGQTAGSPIANYTTVVAPEISRRSGMFSHCHSVPNVYDRQVQMDYVIDSNECQTRDVVMCENVSYAPCVRTIGTVQNAISLPVIASPCYIDACVPACGPVVSTCTCRPCVRTFNTQVCEAPEMVEVVRDTGIAEMEITRAVEPVREAIHRPMKLVSVGTPAQRHYDVSCDALIIPAHASKRNQTEPSEEPKIYETRREERVFTAPPVPMQTMMTQSVVETRGKKLQFEPEMTDVACETPKPESYEIIACQKGIKTSGKKLQVTIQLPESMKLGSGEVIPVKKAGHGKKVQVNLAIPLHVDVTQTIAEPEKPVADFQCDAIQPAPFEIGTSQSIWEEVPQIVLQQEVAPVFAAPFATPTETCNKACETVTPAPLKIGISQSIQREIPTYDFSCDAAPLPMESTRTQAHYVEILPEPLLIASTQSITKAEVATKEFGCEPIPVATQGKKLQVSPGPLSIEAGQALHTEIKPAIIVTQTEAEPIVKKIGKKLQVEPPLLASIATQAIYEEPIQEKLYVGQSQSIWEEPERIIIKPPTPTAVVMSAPPLTSEFGCGPTPIMTDFKTVQIVPEPVVTKDFSCDAPLAILKQDFSCDAPKPIQTVGKKLQVSPTPLAAAVSQSTYIEEELSIIQSQAIYEKVKSEPLARGVSQAIYAEPKQEPLQTEVTQAIWVESPPIMLKENIMPVFSAPVIESADFSCETRPIEIPTKDFACDALVPVETIGKKLQVSPYPLAASSVQAIYEEIKPYPLVVASTQTKISEAPSMKEFSCNPMPIETLGKKLQVSPEPLVSSMSQSIYLEMEKIGKAFQVGPEPMAITVAQAIYFEPKVTVYELYSGQAIEAEKIGKKLQVQPQSLCAMTSQVSPKDVRLSTGVTQTVEPAVVEKVGKKLQVSPKALEVGVSQAVYEEPRPRPLETIRAQSIWVEPEPIIIKPVTPEPIVKAAPSPSTSDFSCNPTLLVTKFKEIQVETAPLVTAGSQVVYVEPKEPPLVHEAAQCSAVRTKDFTSDAPLPPEMIGKKLQVVPTPLTETSIQTNYIAEKPVPLVVGGSQAIYMEPKPIPLTTAKSQVKWVEPAPKHVSDFSCDAPRPVDTFGKKLQVSPEPLALAVLQSTYSEPILPKYGLTAVQVGVQPLSVNVCQTTFTEPSIKFVASQAKYVEPKPEALLAQRSQTLWIEPEPVIIKPPSPKPLVFSAPPITTNDFSCGPLPISSVGKKLQVSPEPLIATMAQASYVEPAIATYETNVVQCRVPETHAKKLQVAPTPLTATSIQTTYIAEKPVPLVVGGSQAIYMEPKPIPLTTAKSQVKWVEPAPKHVSDFSCDAPRPVDTFGKKLQVSPEPLALAVLQSTYSEPILPKYGLTAVQVGVQPLSVNVCQTTFTEPSIKFVASQAKYVEPKPEALLAQRSQTLWIEPEPVIIKPPSPKPLVFSAPPITTNDFSCGPLPISSVGKKLQVSPEPLIATMAQASYVEPAIATYETNVVQCRVPETHAKKLQVAPTPLTATSIQTTYIAEKPVPLVVGGSQAIYMEPKPIPLTTAKSQVKWVEPAPKHVSDFSCDAPRPVDTFGKKLQVSPEPLALAVLQSTYSEPILPKYGLTAVQVGVQPLSVNVCQTTFTEPSIKFVASQAKYVEPKPEALLAQRSQTLWIEPEPVIIKPPSPKPLVFSAPPITTNDFSCGPLPISSVGKKLQVSPEPLIATMAQASYVEPAIATYETNVVQCRVPETHAKKLQVAPTPLTATSIQTTYIAEKPVPLVVGGSQAIYMEPKPIPLTTAKSQVKWVEPAPKHVSDFSCDAPRPVDTFGKKLQVSPEPLALAVLQSTYSEPILPKYGLTAVQVGVQPLSVNVCQTTFTEPSIKFVASQAKYVEPKPEALLAQRSQTLWIEPEPVIIKPPSPKPLVFSAPPITTNDFSCGPLPISSVGKKLQVSPEPLIATMAQASYVEPAIATYETNVVQCRVPETHAKKLQVAPTPLTATSIQTTYIAEKPVPLVVGGSQAIYMEPKPIPLTTAKSQVKWVEPAPKHVSDFSCDAPRPVDTFGKKLQVSPEPLALAVLQSTYSEPILPKYGLTAVQVGVQPLSVNVCQTTFTEPSIKFVASQAKYVEPKPEALLAQRSQTLWIEPEPVIIKPPSPKPLVFSAPPITTNDFSCGPLPISSVGKKLQVSPEPLIATMAQASYVEPAIATYETNVVQCRVPETHAKKLQVAPTPLTATSIQTTYIAEKPVPLVVGGSQAIYMEPKPIPLTTAKSQVKWVEPAPKHVSDFSCDAPRPVDTFGKKLQVSPEPLALAVLQSTYSEPILPKYGLTAVQVGVQPLSVNVCQTTFTEPSIKFVASQAKYVEPKPEALLAQRSQTLWIEPEPVIIKPPSPKPLVFSAPPITTNDFSCGPLPISSVGKKLQVSPEPLIATMAQASYVEPAIATYETNVVQCRVPETHGKKLQVAPTPLTATSIQTTYIAEKPVPLVVGGSQAIYMEPKPIPLTTAKSQVKWVEPAPKHVSDFSCDAPRPVDTFGKKLQVSPEPLALAVLQSTYSEPILPKYGLTAVQVGVQPLSVNVCQTTFTEPSIKFVASQAKYVEPKPEALLAQRSQTLWIEPEPVIIKPPSPKPLVFSAPPITTNDFSCGPLPISSVGKKLQVSPEPLIATMAQASYVEPAIATYETNVVQCRVPETHAKKLQVAPTPLTATSIQTTYIAEKPVPLVVGGSQAIYMEPKPIPLTTAKSQVKWVEPAPKHVSDFSCDAPRPVDTFGKKLQVSPEPLALAVLQSTYSEPILPKYGLTAVQVGVQPLSVNVCQTTFTEPSIKFVASQAKYVEPKPEALLAQRSQTLWIEPEPVIIKPPSPKPLVFSAPPITTNDFSCGPLPISSVGKKLQVSPEPLIATMAQASYVEPAIATYETNVVQCRVPETHAKKLQVAPTPLTATSIQTTYIAEKPVPLVVGGSQAIYMEPKPIPLTTAKSQVKWVEPAPKHVSDFSCDAPRPVDTFGKKLQVSPEPLALAVLQSTYSEPILPKYGLTAVQVGVQPLSVNVCQTTFTEPSIKFVASQAKYVEPKPEALLAQRSQTLWIEPEPVIIKPPSPKPLVFSAPPITTNDFSCGPLPISSVGKKLQVSPEPLIATMAQASYVEPAIATYETNVVQCRVPETHAKKLQVAPTPLTATSIQTTYIAEKPVPLVVGGSQAIYMEPKPIPLTTAKSQVKWVEPAPKHVSDFSCDAPRPVDTFGKKLQVSPEPLALAVLQSTYSEPILPKYGLTAVQVGVQPLSVNVCQTTFTEPSIKFVASQAKYVEPKPEALLAQRSQTLWIEPEPVIIKPPSPKPLVFSAPPITTNDFSCGPLPISSVGKKLQVSPEPLIATMAQASYVEPAIATYETNVVQCRAPEMLGKKIQVMPKSLTACASQTIYVAPVPAALNVTQVQSVYVETVFAVERTQVYWEEPEQFIIKPQTPEKVVMAVPTQPTADFSCDSLLLDTASKELQVSTEPLSRAVANITPKLIPLVTSRGQTAYVDEVMPCYASFAVQCISVKITDKQLQVTPQPLSLRIGRSSAISVEPRQTITTAQTSELTIVTDTHEFSCDPLLSVSHEKKLQVAPEPMATAIMQSPDAQFAVRRSQTVYMEEKLPIYTSCAAQCRHIQTLGKKLQVKLEFPTTRIVQSVVEEPERGLYETTHVQTKSAENISKKLQVHPPPLPTITAQTAWIYRTSRDAASVTDATSTAHASIAPMIREQTGKKLQVSPEVMSIAIIQSGQPVYVDHKGSQFMPEVISTPSQPVEVQKLNKKLQIQPLALSLTSVQTLWEEPIVIKSLSSEGIVMSAPPMETNDTGCDPLLSMEKVNKKVMVRPPLMETTYIQSTIEAAERAPLSTQEVQADIPLATPIIKPTSPVQRDYEAPPIVRETYEAGTQHEVNMRNVRIQKYFDAFEGTANVGIQFSPPAIRRSPPITRVRTADWGVQFNPTAMVGITQTLPIERVPSPRRSSTFTESTQTEVQKEDANLFSFIRETKTKVSKERRARSQGLIAYKTQVPSQIRDHALSVPSMLHVMESGAEQYLYQQQRTTSTHIPKRYGKGGTYDRRLRSMETMYEDGRTKSPQGRLPIHSESDLYRDNVYMRELLRTQQLQLEEKSMDHLQRIVQSIGMERVQSMLKQIWEEEEDEHAIYEEIYGSMYTPRPFPALRYTDVGTQYAIPAYGILYSTDFGVQAGNSHVQWIPLAPGQTVQIESDESTDYDGTYEWDPYQSSWRPRINDFQWVARTAFDFATLTEVTKEEENQFIDRLLRSPALSAYTSDFEMQQAGIKLNYPESGTLSVVSWKPRYMDGEDQLDVDTIGRLLRVSLVGARVPGTGEVISAADAFYRGILRVVYVDDSRSNVMPLPTAIVANAVIVEKQYLSGVGIALHSTSLRFPVECQEMWRTTTLRRRTYRVNSIQKSPNERVDLSKALDEGLIDLTSGELVKITPVKSGAQLEPKESTLGAGEPTAESPERYSVHEAILYDILDVELLAPETVIFPSTEVLREGVIREGETLTKSPGPEEESSDLEA